MTEHVAKATSKKYKCRRCGHEKQIQTNHYGPCRSWDRVNVCPACPPWAKYPEFGGQTTWLCMETEPGDKKCHNQTLTRRQKMDRLETATNIAENHNGKVWVSKGNDGPIRVYFRKGYCQIEDDGVNIDAVNGNMFADVKDYIESLGVKTFRR